MIGVYELIIIAALIVFGVFGSIFWIWAILDCARNESPADNDKIVWILIILLLHWLGALLYTLVRRPERTKG
ncbi:MAG: PLDc N-terminal domain-containing protein [Anaerolineales bacterium]|jgi:hypothetical protein